MWFIQFKTAVIPNEEHKRFSITIHSDVSKKEVQVAEEAGTAKDSDLKCPHCKQSVPQIEPGDKTDEPIRARGWTHWHDLFNPRQLLILGSLMAECLKQGKTPKIMAGLLLGISRCADYNARFSRWHPRSIGDKSEQVFRKKTFSNSGIDYRYSPPFSPGNS